MLKQPNKSCFFQTTSIVKIVLSTLSIKPPFFKVPSIKSIINIDKKSSPPSSSSSSWAVSTTSSGTSTVHFDGSNQMTIDRRQEIAAEAQDITLRSHSLFQQRNSDNVKFNHVKIQLRVDCLKFETWDCCDGILKRFRTTSINGLLLTAMSQVGNNSNC